MMENIEKRLTVEEFLELAERPENAGTRMELIDGEVYMTAAFLNHGEIMTTISGYLFGYVQPRHLGQLISGETGIRLDDGTVLAPDVGFYSIEHAPERLPVSYDFPTAPDLVVEVVSKSNSPTEIQTKLQKYFDHGSSVAWIVYPSVRHVWVYTRNADGRMSALDFGINDTLTGGDVLPGFELPVRAIFED